MLITRNLFEDCHCNDSHEMSRLSCRKPDKLVTFEQTYYNIIPGIPVTTLWNTVKTFNVFITGKNILQHQQFVESLAELNFRTHPKWGWE